jgi:hypothetical protein
LTRVALLHSPLTTALLWRGVADALMRAGIGAFCITLPESRFVHPPYWLTHAATAAEALPEDGEVVLVAHSGAGVLLPAIAKLARNRTHSATVTSFVFVDCDLPRDGCSRFDLMDDASAAQMRARCKDGWLPRWTDADLATLIPDAEARRRFVAELPPVPVAMYEEAIAVPDEWPPAPVRYVQLSRFYPQAVEYARRAGWEMCSLAGHHLLPYTDPQRVAAVLLGLVRTG